MNRALIKGNGDQTQLGGPDEPPVILSGLVCVAMLALGFNLLLPLGQRFGDRVYFNRCCVRYGLFRPCG